MRRPLAAAWILAAGCFSASGTAERPVVTRLEVEGARAVPAADATGRIATQASGRWVWSDAHTLDPDALAADRRRIERLYATRGYYDARVKHVDTRPDGGEGRVIVVFQVEEGEPTRVTELALTGLENAPEAAARVQDLPFRVGDVFTEEAYDKARKVIEGALAETGYARAEVNQSAEVDPDLHVARVTYEVKPGLQYRFGNVFVAGTAEIPRARIREEAEVATPYGETFRSSALARAQLRVFDLGVFGGVRTTEGQADDGKRTIPVVVSVREAPFRTIRLGPGVGVNLTRWDVHGVAGWTHRNWLGGLRRLQLDLRLGYAGLPNFLPGRLEQAGLVGLAAADLTQPGALTRRVDVSLRLEGEKGLEQAYGFYAERVRLGTPIKLARAWTLIPSYNLEIYELTGTADVFNGSGSAPPLLASCGELCVLSYLEERIAWDGRDDVLDTHRGIYAGLSAQQGFPLGSLGGFKYLRFLPELRGYLPLSRRLVLASRVRYGALLPIGNDPSKPEDLQTPIVQRFTAGGPNSMRGYATRRLAPMVFSSSCQQTTPSQPPSCKLTPVPVGGDGMLDGSFELRFPISGDFGGVGFVDFGNVSRSYGGALKLADLQWAAGAGVRYKTPFGPLRLDLGFRLPHRTAAGWELPGLEVFDPYTGKNTGYVQQESSWAIQLSLGEAF